VVHSTGVCRDGKRSIVVTLEEALRIDRSRLPEEGPEDPLASWRASKPLPEPVKAPRGLDTAPPIDWASIIRATVKAERAFLTDIVGRALAEYGNDVIAEVETMITAAVDRLRAELHVELANQLDQLRSELFGRIDSVHTQGDELRAQLEEIIAKKKRARKALIQLPAPNGDAQRPQ
jgi:hypothetical protein